MMISPSDYLDEAEEAEGRHAHLYLDTRGIATVGVGHAIRDFGELDGLGFLVDGRRATADDLRADWDEIHRVGKGKKASAYARATRCRLLEDRIDLLFGHDCGDKIRGLTRGIEGFDSFPRSAQLALLDMTFNLGVAGLKKKFPKMMAAVKNRDWEGTALECNRPDVGQTRNDRTRALFREAARWAAGGAIKPTAHATDDDSTTPVLPALAGAATPSPASGANPGLVGSEAKPGLWAWVKSKRLWLGGLPLGLGGGADLGIDAVWDKAVEWFGEHPDHMSVLWDHVGKLEFLKSRAALILIALGLAGLLWSFYADRGKRS